MLATLLFAAILVGLWVGFVGVRRYFRERDLIKVMRTFSYEEISSKWSLWDDFVNCYYEDEKGNFRQAEGQKISKAKYMLYDEFYRCPPNEKIKMLIDEFGPERQ